jgi:hypothetical protein
VLSTSVCEQTIIVAAAKRYAARYGADAADYARRFAAAILVAGNVDGWRIWFAGDPRHRGGLSGKERHATSCRTRPGNSKPWPVARLRIAAASHRSRHSLAKTS